MRIRMAKQGLLLPRLSWHGIEEGNSMKQIRVVKRVKLLWKKKEQINYLEQRKTS